MGSLISETPMCNPDEDNELLGRTVGTVWRQVLTRRFCGRSVVADCCGVEMQESPRSRPSMGCCEIARFELKPAGSTNPRCVSITRGGPDYLAAWTDWAVCPWRRLGRALAGLPVLWFVSCNKYSPHPKHCFSSFQMVSSLPLSSRHPC